MSGELDVGPGGGLVVQEKFATDLSITARRRSSSQLVHTDDDPEECGGSRSESDSNVPPSGNGLFRCDRCDIFESRSKAGLMAHVCKGLASPIQSTANSNITTTATTPTNNNNNNPSITNHNLIGMVAGLLKKEAGVAMDAESATATAADGHTMAHHHNNNNNQEANNNNSNVINHNTGSAPNSQNSHHRKLFECDVCNMKFSNGANMRRHKMRHTGVKPYECRICQKR